MGFLRGFVDVDLAGEGKVLDLVDDYGEALGGVRDEAAEIAHDGGKGDAEEEDGGAEDDEKEDDDADGARGAVLAEAERFDVADDGGEDDGEESADVEDFKLFEEVPGDIQGEQDADGEEDVTVDGAALLRSFDGANNGGFWRGTLRHGGLDARRGGELAARVAREVRRR